MKEDMFRLPAGVYPLSQKIMGIPVGLNTTHAKNHHFPFESNN